MVFSANGIQFPVGGGFVPVDRLFSMLDHKSFDTSFIAARDRPWRLDRNHYLSPTLCLPRCYATTEKGHVLSRNRPIV